MTDLPEGFERETRYLVFKNSDMKCLTGTEKNFLSQIQTKINAYRILGKGKRPFKCVIVEDDWPEYEPTWQAIETRVSRGGKDE